MKYFNLLIVLSFIISCSKTSNEENEYEKDAKKYYSFAEANGKEWKGTASVINKMNKNSDSLLVGLAVYNSLGFRVQALNFVNLPITQDTIFLKPVYVSYTLSFAYYSTFLEDGDAVVDEYILDEKAASKNWVLIKKILFRRWLHHHHHNFPHVCFFNTILTVLTAELVKFLVAHRLNSF